MGALFLPLVAESRVATQMPVSIPLVSPWVAVRHRFRQFHEHIKLRLPLKVGGQKKLNGVLSCLKQTYYDHSSEEATGVLIGSSGKDLATHPLGTSVLISCCRRKFTTGSRTGSATASQLCCRKCEVFEYSCKSLVLIT